MQATFKTADHEDRLRPVRLLLHQKRKTAPIQNTFCASLLQCIKQELSDDRNRKQYKARTEQCTFA